MKFDPIHDGIDEWVPIRFIDNAPDDMIVCAGVPACDLFPKGRVAFWKVSILRNALSDNAPNHLKFPATHFRQPPDAPTEFCHDRKWS